MPLPDDIRLPPFSPGSEQALIGAALQRYEVAMDAARETGITSESFYIMANRLVWGAIERLDRKGIPIDAITVTNELRQAGEDDAAGGGAHLDVCIESCITPSQALEYAVVVKEKQTRRDIIESARQAADKAMSDRDGCEEDALSLLTDLSSRMAGVGGNKSHISDLMKVVRSSWERTLEHGFDGVPTGFYPLGRIIGGYRYGELSVVAGYRGEGKSLWMGNEAKAAAKAGIPTLIISLEMPKDRIVARLEGDTGDFSTFKFDMGAGESHDWEGLAYAEVELHKIPLWVEDGSRELSSVLRLIRHHVVKNKVRCVWLDYMQLMQIGDYTGNRNNEIGRISGALVDVARQHRLALIALSQFSRDPDKADRRPRLSDLRDSGCIEQDARMVILLAKDPKCEPIVTEYADGRTRKEYRYIAEVAKHNAGPMGEVGFTRQSSRQRWVPEIQDESVNRPEAEGGDDPISAYIPKAELDAARGLPE